MYHEEHGFRVTFSLEAHFPDDYDGDDDERAWLHDWETRIRPDVVKAVFRTLRQYPSWSAHIRNRGMAATDEIEVALVKDYTRGRQGET